MSSGVGHRHSSGLVLMWLWCKLAAAAPIGPLTWELPYAMGAALKTKKKKKKNTKDRTSRFIFTPYPKFNSKRTADLNLKVKAVQQSFVLTTCPLL